MLTLSGITLQGNGYDGPLISSGGPLFLDQSRLEDSDVGLEARSGTRSVLHDVAFSDMKFADVTYQSDVQIQIIDSYAEKLYDLTKDSLSTIDSELNFIAYRLIDTTNPNVIARLGRTLLDTYQKVPSFFRDGVKFEVVVKIIETIFQVDIPIF
jgi:hypothetical protein